MPPIGVAKAHLKKLLYRLVMSVREVVLTRPRLRALLRWLGAPLIWLLLSLNQGEPAPTVVEPVLRLPLDYDPPPGGLTTAILLHAHHVEVLPDFAGCLRRMPFAADLIVTTDTEAKRQAALAAFRDWGPGTLEVRVTPNRGRNVAPQLIACRDVYDSHELVLFLHTKKSSHTDALSGWRDFMLRDLAAGPSLMRSVMEAFTSLPKLGVISPRIFPEVRRHMLWGESYATCHTLAERLGFSLYPDSPLDFPAGFMFWARSAALRPLLDLNLEWRDFAPEQGQKDGTLAHAIERLIFHSCELAGLRWIRAGVELEPAPAEAFYAAWNPRVLARALTDRARTVLVPGRQAQPVASTDAETIFTANDPKQAFRAACRAELGAFLAGPGRLELATSDTPVVSILLVLFNQAELTFECLRSLTRAMDVPCEVIIVDNASSDRTGELLARIDGAQVVKNGANLHFLRAVNQGAALARGRHLLLLNNDTRVAPGSIGAAVERLDAEADLGAVGGRITLLDGKLQEAGSIIWSDGTCLGYGRGQDPWAPEFQFRRDVDYCSGAFLMVRRDLFERLGRLDMAFAPAYYEETDFCMRLRAAGYRIGYDPRIQLTHFEFGSAASSEQALALQQAHYKLFRERHAVALEAEHRRPGAPVLEARMRGAHRGRVLIVDDQIPYPQLGAGYPRALDLLRAVTQAGWFVTYYPAVYPDVDYDAAYKILPPEVEIAAERGADRLADFMRERPGFYDAAIVSRPHNMEVFRAALAEASGFISMSKLVYDAEAIFALRDEARARLIGEVDRGLKERMQTEVGLSRGAAVVLAVNEHEAGNFRRAGAGDVRVLGHALEPRPTDGGFDVRRDLLFVGALDEDDSPNADSLEFFVREVMPRLDAQIGDDYVLRVVGRNGAPRVRALALANGRVQLLGRVDDLDPLYARSRLFIAPTRYSAGIPMKVHEAAARGLPVAATSLLARQLGWADGEALTVGDAADEFADACARLYADAAAWELVRAGALARVSAECDPAAFAAGVVAALEAAAGVQAASSSSSLRTSVTAEATPPSKRMTLLQ